MSWFPKLEFGALMLACAMSAMAQGAVSSAATIRSVSVLGAGKSLEVEIVASEPVTPETLTITGPDRLVFDFPNSVPGNKLRNLQVNRGHLKGVRVGLFTANPPVTRVVLDLHSPQGFKLFPSGKTVIVKLTSDLEQPAAQPVMAASPMPPPPAPPPPPRMKVEYNGGKLRIWANRATIAEVLNAVRQRTGAEISVPPGAGQEPIFADLGPAPAREVLASFLNGSQFNFVIVGADNDPARVRSVVLTARGRGPDTSISYPAVTAQQYTPEPAMEAPPEAEPQAAVPDQPAEDNQGSQEPPPGMNSNPPPPENPPQQ